MLVAILATYGLTLLLTSAEGPYGIFARLRSVKFMSALRCFMCASVWVAAVIALYPATDFLNWLITLLGLSGGAVFLNYITIGRA